MCIPPSRPRRVLLLAALTLAACAAPKSHNAAKHLAIFESAWATIAAKHFDQDLGGVDWKQISARYRPLVEQTRSEAELAAVLNAMVAELGHSHVAVLSPQTEPLGQGRPAAGRGQGETEPATTGKVGDGVAGLRAGLLDERLIVTAVEPGGPAARAGIAAGDELCAIAGRESKSLLDQLRRHGGERWRGLAGYAVEAALQGPVGKDVSVEVAAATGERRHVTMERTAPTLPPLALGNLGSIAAEFESRTLEDGTLYVRFTPCFVPLQERLEDALAEARTQHGEPRGFILDLRDNPGGFGAVAMGVARHFLQDELELGTMRMRDAPEPLRFKVNPSPTPYRGPLVVIVNGGTGSTAEILAAGLQKLGRVRVVGERSMGAALPSVVETIAHGWRVQAVIADFTLPDGTSVEGVGVTPDVMVKPTREDYAAQRDPLLDAAQRELANAPTLPARAVMPDTEVVAGPSPRPACVVDEEVGALLERMAHTTARLSKATSVRMTSGIEFMGLRGRMVITLLRTGKFHISSHLPGAGESVQVFDGARGWSRDAIQGLRELEGEELVALQRATRLDYAAWREMFARIELIERRRDGEAEILVLRQTPHEGEGKPMTVEVDARALELRKMTSTTKTGLGSVNTVAVVEQYGEYDGVRLPATSNIRIGQASMRSVLEKVEYDVEVAEELFAKPAAAKPKPARSK